MGTAGPTQVRDSEEKGKPQGKSVKTPRGKFRGHALSLASFVWTFGRRLCSQNTSFLSCGHLPSLQERECLGWANHPHSLPTLVSWGGHSQVPPMVASNNRHLFSRCPGGWSPKPKCPQGCTPSKGPGETPLAPSGFWWLPASPGILWFGATSLQSLSPLSRG